MRCIGKREHLKQCPVRGTPRTRVEKHNLDQHTRSKVCLFSTIHIWIFVRLLLLLYNDTTDHFYLIVDVCVCNVLYHWLGCMTASNQAVKQCFGEKCGWRTSMDQTDCHCSSSKEIAVLTDCCKISMLLKRYE